MGEFDGKVALITGGSAGIGAAACFSFARRGAKVVLTARRAKEGEAVAQAVRDEGGDAVFVQADVAIPEQARGMVEETVKRFGRLDYAFNNAGIEGEKCLTHECTTENWDRTMSVNLHGVWYSMKYEIPEMLKVGGGVIVNMSSGVGVSGGAGIPAYVASRHAVVGLTKSAALEYADKNIRINVVCPGSVKTPMHYRLWSDGRNVEDTDEFIGDLHPLGRVAEPEEIAEATAWLCSDKSSYVTGHPLVLDGAWTAQ
ncbi:MAG: glucose 1-dehydrogenase [Chloroflexi bacterium]|nr:glucose 1-dehydrogenase [Chloroflexota bacterium]